MGSRPRAQSPLSVNKTSQWQLACVLCPVHPTPQRGYKRRSLDVVASWLRLMVTIAVSRAWAISTLRQRSWMSHVLIAGTWPSQCCGPDIASLNEGVSPLPCPILVLPSLSSGGLLRLMVRVIWGSRWDLPRRVRLCRPLIPPALHTLWCFRTSLLDPRTGRGPASRSERKRTTGGRARLWRWRSAALPPSGRVALPESDPELTAMLSRAVESVGGADPGVLQECTQRRTSP